MKTKSQGRSQRLGGGQCHLSKVVRLPKENFSSGTARGRSPFYPQGIRLASSLETRAYGPGEWEKSLYPETQSELTNELIRSQYVPQCTLLFVYKNLYLFNWIEKFV